MKLTRIPFDDTLGQQLPLAFSQYCKQIWWEKSKRKSFVVQVLIGIASLAIQTYRKLFKTESLDNAIPEFRLALYFAAMGYQSLYHAQEKETIKLCCGCSYKL